MLKTWIGAHLRLRRDVVSVTAPSDVWERFEPGTRHAVIEVPIPAWLGVWLARRVNAGR